MNFKKLTTLICLLLAGFVSQSQSTDEIINGYLKAMGGKEKLAALKTLKMTGNIDIGPDMKAPCTIYLKEGKKMRFELDVQGMKLVQAIDGDSGWYINPFGGKSDPERMPPDMLEDSKEQADFTGPLYNYREKGNTVELIGKEDMEGTETFKLKVGKKNGDISYIYIDASSYLELKETSKHKFQDKEIEAASLSSDYKSVDGIMFPFSMETRGSDEASQGQALNLLTVEVNPKIDDSMFKMPAAGSSSGTEGKK